MTADTQYTVSLSAFVVSSAVVAVGIIQGSYGNTNEWNRRDTLVAGTTFAMAQGTGDNLMHTTTIPLTNAAAYVTLVKSSAENCSDSLQSITHRW